MTLIQFADLCPPAFSFLTRRYHFDGKSHHRDVEGVRLAILELSGGRLESEYHRPFQELLDRLVKRRKLAAEVRLAIEGMPGGEYRKLLRLLELIRAGSIRPTKAEIHIIARLAARLRISPRTWEMLR